MRDMGQSKQDVSSEQAWRPTGLEHSQWGWGGGVGSRRNTPTEKHSRQGDEESDGTEGRLTLLWERRG